VNDRDDDKYGDIDGWLYWPSRMLLRDRLLSLLLSELCISASCLRSHRG
jgi:hypothetical protein